MGLLLRQYDLYKISLCIIISIYKLYNCLKGNGDIELTGSSASRLTLTGEGEAKAMAARVAKM